jgi:protease-4
MSKLKLGLLVVGIVLFLCIFSIGAAVIGGSENGFTQFAGGSCNTAHLVVAGELVTTANPADLNLQTTSSDVAAAVELANNDSNIDSIVVDLDSPGGSPVAGEEISNSFKSSTKPVVVVIRGTGSSAAYWAASGASKIFASENSDVGGIGVIASYLDEVTKNNKDGYRYNVVTSGEFKTIGDPEVLLTERGRELIQRDVDIMHANFVAAVSKNRSLEIKKVESFADGSTMLGKMAKEKGLIDEIGGISESKVYIQSVIGKPVILCPEEPSKQTESL